MRVRFTARAHFDLARAEDWWLRNREKNPFALEEDLTAAIEILRANPGAGVRARNVRRPDVLRLHLRRVRYDLYYTVDANGVLVHALWHASRRPPKL